MNLLTLLTKAAVLPFQLANGLITALAHVGVAMN